MRNLIFLKNPSSRYPDRMTTIQNLLPSQLGALEALINNTPCDWSITQLRDSVAQNDMMLCAFLDDTLAGFVCVKKSKFNWEVLQLLGASSYRRQHSATRLWQHVIHEAQQSNIDALQLEVRRSN